MEALKQPDREEAPLELERLSEIPHEEEAALGSEALAARYLKEDTAKKSEILDFISRAPSNQDKKEGLITEEHKARYIGLRELEESHGVIDAISIFFKRTHFLKGLKGEYKKIRPENLPFSTPIEIKSGEFTISFTLEPFQLQAMSEISTPKEAAEFVLAKAAKVTCTIENFQIKNGDEVINIKDEVPADTRILYHPSSSRNMHRNKSCALAGANVVVAHGDPRTEEFTLVLGHELGHLGKSEDIFRNSENSSIGDLSATVESERAAWAQGLQLLDTAIGKDEMISLQRAKQLIHETALRSYSTVARVNMWLNKVLGSKRLDKSSKPGIAKTYARLRDNEPVNLKSNFGEELAELKGIYEEASEVTEEEFSKGMECRVIQMAGQIDRIKLRIDDALSRGGSFSSFANPVGIDTYNTQRITVGREFEILNEPQDGNKLSLNIYGRDDEEIGSLIFFPGHKTGVENEKAAAYDEVLSIVEEWLNKCEEFSLSLMLTSDDTINSSASFNGLQGFPKLNIRKVKKILKTQ